MARIENSSISTAALCRILDVPAHEFRSWIERHGLFRQKQAGSGRGYGFSIQNVFTAAAVHALIEAGFTTREAVDAIQPYVSPYDEFLRGETRTLSRHDGRWVAVGGDDFVVTLKLNPVAMWNAIKARVAAEFGDEAVAGLETAVAKLHRERQSE
jgi:hypothetical protein